MSGEYKNSEGKLTKTGGNPRFEPPAQDQRGGARVFDSLVSTNLSLVKSIRLNLIASVVMTIIGAIMFLYFIVTLQRGQADIARLIVTIGTQKCQ